MSAGELVLLGGAAFTAGGVNAVAGGGSLVSFPALVAAASGTHASRCSVDADLVPVLPRAGEGPPPADGTRKRGTLPWRR